MPITDYKVTDIERDAVRMEGKADPLNGTLAQNQAEFDEYAELVRDNLDGLCDYIATMPIAYLSSAAAATANKGAITGFVPLGAILEISMTNGNTSASPTVSIDGVTHTITSMPTTAQVQANSTQTYRLVKTGATALTFTANPDYICERGEDANGWVYERLASGIANCSIRHNIGSITLSSLFITVNTPLALYATVAAIGHNFPFTFVAVKYSITNVESSSAYLISTGGLDATTSAPAQIGLGEFANNNATVITNVVLNNKTMGTWK